MEMLEEALQQGIMPAIVIAIYLILVKIIDNRKENVQIKMNNDLVKSINTISTFIINITKNLLDKDKSKFKVAVHDSFDSSALRLATFFSNTVVNNHIETDKDSVLSNIQNIVNAEYYSIFSTLSLYTIDDIKASDSLKKEWITEIEKTMKDLIYNKSLSNEEKIVSFSNKLKLKFQNYVTYILNKILK